MNNEKFLIPGAIVLAGFLIAGGIYLSGGSFDVKNKAAVVEGGSAPGAEAAPDASAIRAVDLEADHIYGSPDAKVTIVEYSDFECTFCARHHPTLETIVDESDGEVNWVYRHFPLTQIHSRAMRASLASECVAELAGNDEFWIFSEQIFANMRNLGDELYTAEAEKLGISGTDLIACIDSGRHQEKVDADMQNAIDTGGRGTPHNVIITAGGDAIPFSGALPIENVRQIVDRAKSS